MASSKIKSDIQRDGFLDKAGAGTVGQVRTLNSSNQEVWADSSGGIVPNTGSGAIVRLGRRVSTGTDEVIMGRRV